MIKEYNIINNPDLSICIIIKNRSHLIVDYEEIPLGTLKKHSIELSGLKKNIPNIIENNKIKLELFKLSLISILKQKKENEKWEFIITDFNSNDVEMDKYLKNILNNNPYKLISINESFNRGRGLNICIKNASSENIFCCDTDILFTSREVFDKAYNIIENRIYFPICFGLIEPTWQIGYWRKAGYGMNFFKKKLLKKYWTEKESYGKEDNIFFNYYKSINLIIREKVNGYYHMWHPENMLFKNKYYKENIS